MGFQKGQSGNPKGRPRGVLNQARLRETVAKDLPDILRSLAAAAKAGDTQAARLLLDRTLPALKAVDCPAPISLGPGLAGASGAVLEALASGDTTPDQAASLASVLTSLARVREITDLEQRIAALEASIHEAAQNPR